MNIRSKLLLLLVVMSTVSTLLAADLAHSYTFTTGHGLHPLAAFLGVLGTWGATAVAFTRFRSA